MQASAFGISLRKRSRGTTRSVSSAVSARERPRRLTRHLLSLHLIHPSIRHSTAPADHWAYIDRATAGGGSQVCVIAAQPSLTSSRSQRPRLRSAPIGVPPGQCNLEASRPPARPRTRPPAMRAVSTSTSVVPHFPTHAASDRTLSSNLQREQGAASEPPYHLPYGQGEVLDRAVG